MGLGSRAARVIGIVAILWLFALALAGCGRESGAPSAPVRSAAPADTLTIDEIRDMSMSTDDKRRAMPPEFPSPVPVIEGEIAEASAAGGVVFYTLRAAGSHEQTAEWYRRMYVIANWTLIRDSSVEGPEGPTRILQFEKGDAGSTISVRSGNGGGSVVEGTVTVGTVSSEV